MPEPREMRLHDLDEEFEPSPLAHRRTNTEKHFADVEIANLLGRLGITRTGDLAGIEFDERVLRTMSPATVSQSLVAAFQAAIGQVRRQPLEKNHA